MTGQGGWVGWQGSCSVTSRDTNHHTCASGVHLAIWVCVCVCVCVCAGSSSCSPVIVQTLQGLPRECYALGVILMYFKEKCLIS